MSCCRAARQEDGMPIEPFGSGTLAGYLTLSSRHLRSPQLAARWCPGLTQGAPSARPSAQTASFRAAGPQAEACGSWRKPPAAWRGGLPERVCPVGPFSIVPRRLAGGSRPTPPGRRRDRKAQPARRGDRGLRLSAGRRARMRPSVRPRGPPPQHRRRPPQTWRPPRARR